MRTRIILIVILTNLMSVAYGACRNYDLIARQANIVSRDLFDLRFEVRTSFPNSWSLYDLIQRAELDASFLNRVTRSGAMPCWQTQANYRNLQRSTDVLRNYFRGFFKKTRCKPRFI